MWRDVSVWWFYDRLRHAKLVAPATSPSLLATWKSAGFIKTSSGFFWGFFLAELTLETVHSYASVLNALAERRLNYHLAPGLHLSLALFNAATSADRMFFKRHHFVHYFLHSGVGVPSVIITVPSRSVLSLMNLTQGTKEEILVVQCYTPTCISTKLSRTVWRHVHVPFPTRPSFGL